MVEWMLAPENAHLWLHAALTFAAMRIAYVCGIRRGLMMADEDVKNGVAR